MYLAIDLHISDRISVFENVGGKERVFVLAGADLPHVVIPPIE
jgi:hypothetical protein